MLRQSLKQASDDLEKRLESESILDRIMTNWKVPVAAYLAIRDYIEFPFSYSELIEVVVKGIKTQNSMCNTTDEVAGFWNIVNAAVQMGELKKTRTSRLRQSAV